MCTDFDVNNFDVNNFNVNNFNVNSFPIKKNQKKWILVKPVSVHPIYIRFSSAPFDLPKVPFLFWILLEKQSKIKVYKIYDRTFRRVLSV